MPSGNGAAVRLARSKSSNRPHAKRRTPFGYGHPPTQTRGTSLRTVPRAFVGPARGRAPKASDGPMPSGRAAAVAPVPRLSDRSADIHSSILFTMSKIDRVDRKMPADRTDSQEEAAGNIVRTNVTKIKMVAVGGVPRSPCVQFGRCSSAAGRVNVRRPRLNPKRGAASSATTASGSVASRTTRSADLPTANP
jgi:hypothetical protein